MKVHEPSQAESGSQGWLTANSFSAEIALIRNRRESYQAWCEHCFESVPALTPESAGELLLRTVAAISKLMERGELHAVETGAPEPLVCGKSLSANSTKIQKRNEGERK